MTEKNHGFRCTLEGGAGGVACQYLHNGQGMDYLILAGTYFILMFTVSGILMGYLADKVHRPRLVAACVALFSTCGTCMAFTSTYWHLVVLRLGIAAGWVANLSVNMGAGTKIPCPVFFSSISKYISSRKV